MVSDRKKNIDGSLWLNMESNSFMGHGRIELLEKIELYGSISKAAKEMKMSYKAAWDSIDAMNNIAPEPLVYKSTGGKGGGGTKLTEYGIELINVYKTADAEHKIFLQNLTHKIRNFEAYYTFFQRASMKLSARNQFMGKISEISKGDVNTLVRIKISDTSTVYSSVTNESIKELDIKNGMDLYVIVKASSVNIVQKSENIKTNAKNRLCGEIISITTGSANSEVVIKLNEKNTIVSTITNSSANDMKLISGDQVCAVFKASDVILGV